MATIELLREKLHRVIENGSPDQILEASRELDCEILKIMKGCLSNKTAYPTICYEKNRNNGRERGLVNY